MVKGWVAIQAGTLAPVTAPVQVLGEWLAERSPTKIVLLSPSVTSRDAEVAVAIKQPVACQAEIRRFRPSGPPRLGDCRRRC